MILFEICGNREDHPAYQNMAVANLARQYDFVRSAVVAATETKRAYLSQTVIKALNFQAITCLHTNAGEYKPCPVHVTSADGDISKRFIPPDHFRVAALMDDFINEVNRNWDKTDPVVLAAYVLWRLNWIHPFINGNGRTARVTCLYVLCLCSGGWLHGTRLLPDLIQQNRDEYEQGLKAVDASIGGQLNLAPLHSLIVRLLDEQLKSATAPA